MTDGGSHFCNEEVSTYCKMHAIEHIMTPAYAPWTNGLVENVNKILIGCLKQMCAPDTDDMEANDPDPESTPAQWMDHIDEAVHSMNDRIIPALGFTPWELLWGRRETTEERVVGDMKTETTGDDVAQHLIFLDLLCSQGHSVALSEAMRWKAQFDDRVHPVEFNVGNMVQVYNSWLDTTYETRAKLMPRWSPPRTVTDRLLNSYMLCKLDGTDLDGTTHARRLRRFIPRRDGPLGHTLATEAAPDWIWEWDKEEEAIEAIGGLFGSPDATRACIPSKGG